MDEKLDYQDVNTILSRCRQALQHAMNKVATGQDAPGLKALEQIVDIGLKLRNANIATLDQELQSQPDEALIVLRDAVILELNRRSECQTNPK
jgi:hypothetical protein